MARFIRIAVWALVLNTLWEFGQCLFFYDMWSWPFWKSTIWMWVAIFGDILIVLGLWKGASFLNGLWKFHRPSSTGYLMLLLLSFGASIVLEWVAIYFNLWSYDPAMPVVDVGNRSVGLLPVLQITFLPALSVWLAAVWRNTAICNRVLFHCDLASIMHIFFGTQFTKATFSIGHYS